MKKKLHTKKNNSTIILDEKTVTKDPFEQFRIWFDDVTARNIIPFPNAMILATADKRIPSARVVLLKEFDKTGFVFFTNYNSKKAKELNKNPLSEFLFYWPVVERQVRISGRVEKISTEESNNYFKTRPRGNQIGAWASPQSKEVKNKDELDNLYKKYENKFENKNIPKPGFWGGYKLVPHNFEFWQMQPNRFHDRIFYALEKNGIWKIKRLAP